MSLHLGGVEEVDAGIVGGVEEAQRARRPALLSHRHRPCKNYSHAQAGVIQAQSTREGEREFVLEPKQRRETGRRSGARWKVAMAIPVSSDALLGGGRC